MKKRDDLISQTAGSLKEIKTIEDLKASKELVFDSMERVFASSVEELRNFIEFMDTLPEEEKKMKALMFQDENFFLPEAIVNEMDRIDELPGGQEYLDQFSTEMENKLEKYIDQYGELGVKLMDKLVGNAFDGLVEGMESAMEGMSEVMGGMADVMGDMVNGMKGGGDEEEFIFDYDNPNTPRMLYELYAAKTLDDLNKEILIEDLEEQMQNDIWELETLTDESFGGPQEDDIERISDMRSRSEVFIPEMEKEFARLGAKSGNMERAEALKKEVLSRLSLKVNEIKHYLSQLKL